MALTKAKDTRKELEVQSLEFISMERIGSINANARSHCLLALLNIMQWCLQ